MTKIPRDDGLLSEPTTEVNGNDPQCKRVMMDFIGLGLNPFPEGQNVDSTELYECKRRF